MADPIPTRATPPGAPLAAPEKPGQGPARGKGLTFAHIGGSVLWFAGGPAVSMTPAMIDHLIDDLTREGCDGALSGDIEHVRRATRLLNELKTACREATRWVLARQFDRQGA